MIARLVKSMVKKNKVVIKHGLSSSFVKVNFLVHPSHMPKNILEAQPKIRIIDPHSIELTFADPEVIKSCWDVVIEKDKRGSLDDLK